MSAHPLPPPQPAATAATDLDSAVVALRELILAGEHYRLVMSTYLGLTVNESQAVSYLLARGPMGQSDLGTALGFTTSSITGLVDRLVHAGMVERAPHPSDRRRVIITLSPTGQDRLSTARQWLSHAFTTVDPADLIDLTVVLRHVAESLRAHTDTLENDQAGRPRRPRRV